MRVLILFCEEGEGHAAAARALGHGLEEAGAEVVVHDAMQAGLGRLIPLLSRDAYHVQVQRLRWTYGLEYLLFTRFPPLRAVGRRGLAFFGGRPLLRLIREVGPDLVVSTHPAVTNVLGSLRRRRMLHVPAAATITDLGVHPLWAHPGVDLHLVMHEAVVPAVEAVAGAASAAVVAPLVGPEFGTRGRREQARRALDLPAEGPIVLLSGGAWGVGDLEASVAAALELPEAFVVCLCGRNDLLRRRLERRFAGVERIRVLPFTDRMPELLAAADALVDSSLGVTCLEAISAGCRVIACGAPPGHSRDNARALARLGLAERAGSPRELPRLLARALDSTAPAPGRLPDGPSAAAAVLGVEPRLAPRRSRRRPVAASAAAGAAALVLAGWTFASPTPYPVVARMFDLEVLSHVDTPAPDVAVVVATPQGRIPGLAREFERHGMRVSFAITSPPDRAEELLMARLHDGLLPVLAPAGARGMLQARTELLRLRRALHLGSSFFYLRPQSGFTLADYVAARAAGGTPVVGTGQLRAGNVLVLDAAGGYREGAVAALASSLASRGLRAVPLDELLDAASTRPTGLAAVRASAPSPVASSPATSPRSRSGDAGHHSRASTGASTTGTNVVSANTTGAT